MLTITFTKTGAERKMRMAESCREWSIVGHWHPVSRNPSEVLE